VVAPGLRLQRQDGQRQGEGDPSEDAKWLRRRMAENVISAALRDRA
jgi:hypothetical protein